MCYTLMGVLCMRLCVKRGVSVKTSLKKSKQAHEGVLKRASMWCCSFWLHSINAILKRVVQLCAQTVQWTGIVGFFACLSCFLHSRLCCPLTGIRRTASAIRESVFSVFSVVRSEFSAYCD